MSTWANHFTGCCLFKRTFLSGMEETFEFRKIEEAGRKLYAKVNALTVNGKIIAVGEPPFFR